MTKGSAQEIVLVWDLPVRMVHWGMVLLIPFMWWSARDGQMELHRQAGLILLGLVIFRLVWGMVGSSTARFKSFVRGPLVIAAYLRTLMHGQPVSSVGHNPAGALSAIALLSLVLVQASLGLIAQDSDAIVSGPLNHLVSWDTATAATSAHEIVFYSLVCLIALHIAAVGWYRYSKSINLVRPMISGRMTAPDQVATQPHIASMWRAFLVGLAVAAVTVWLAWGAPPWGAAFPWQSHAAVVAPESYM